MSDRGGGRNEACEEPAGLDHSGSRAAARAKGRLLLRKSKYVLYYRGLGREIGGHGPPHNVREPQRASEDFAGRSGSRHDQHGSPRPAAVRFDPAPSADGRCTGQSSCCSREPSVRVAIGLMLPPTRTCDASGRATRHCELVQFYAEAVLHSVLETGWCGLE